MLGQISFLICVSFLASVIPTTCPPIPLLFHATQLYPTTTRSELTILFHDAVVENEDPSADKASPPARKHDVCIVKGVCAR